MPDVVEGFQALEPPSRTVSIINRDNRSIKKPDCTHLGRVRQHSGSSAAGARKRLTIYGDAFCRIRTVRVVLRAIHSFCEWSKAKSLIKIDALPAGMRGEFETVILQLGPQEIPEGCLW